MTRGAVLGVGAKVEVEALRRGARFEAAFHRPYVREQRRERFLGLHVESLPHGARVYRGRWERVNKGAERSSGPSAGSRRVA